MQNMRKKFDEKASKIVLAALSAITSRFDASRFGDDKVRFFRPEEIVFSIPPLEEENRTGPKFRRGTEEFSINPEDVFFLLEPYIHRELVLTKGKRSEVPGAVDSLRYRANNSVMGYIVAEVGHERLQEFRWYSGLKA